MLRPGFIQQCESTRTRFADTEMGMSDVFDGAIWKDFITIDGAPFLSECNNYGLLLNIDWLQPFKHITYSVGVIYIVILNLPRCIRFKQENVILCGIIPGPREPSLTINTYLAPLVSDLLDLWKGVKLKQPGTENTATFRCALLGVACDLPAARKVCGFLSFSANLGCSRCYQQFSRGFGNRNCYDDFNRSEWELRTNARHRSDVDNLRNCSSKSQLSEKESSLGCRYTALLDLPYYRPIEMTLIDPMHNLFLGTAKHFARDIWIGRSILQAGELAKIESRLRNAIVPIGLGRLPVSINTGIFLTADQWKNWTLYFSIYCLKELLPDSELECWRHFVLSCRRLCQFCITSDDIKIADALLLRFCKRSVHLYGSDAATPNMHMHAHLAACIQEFGPAHSFWLFPFERYNGILEGQPTNNRSIELQLMRRFRKDNWHLQLQHETKALPLADHFKEALPEPLYDISSSLQFDTATVPGPRSVMGVLSDNCVTVIRKFYSDLYPHQANLFLGGQIPISTTYRKYCSVKWRGKIIESTLSRNVKNPFVFVCPPFPFRSTESATRRLAEIEFFLIHSVTIPEHDEPVSHLLACANWPMVHPKQNYFGKPVEVWSKNLYEPNSVNRFFLASSIDTQSIISFDEVSGESVLLQFH